MWLKFALLHKLLNMANYALIKINEAPVNRG